MHKHIVERRRKETNSTIYIYIYFIKILDGSLCGMTAFLVLLLFFECLFFLLFRDRLLLLLVDGKLSGKVHQHPFSSSSTTSVSEDATTTGFESGSGCLSYLEAPGDSGVHADC